MSNFIILLGREVPKFKILKSQESNFATFSTSHHHHHFIYSHYTAAHMTRVISVGLLNYKVLRGEIFSDNSCIAFIIQ